MTGSTADATSSEPTGERFDPLFMHGHLIEAEHLSRYAWAAQFANGRRVLDAACGMAYGSAMLAAGGATEVVGVDLDESVVARVRAAAKPGTSFEVADIRKLPFGDDEFDLVVCFEAIEHVTEPEVVLDELARVLRPDGLLLVSTPNRDVYTPGNPFHLRELTPSEFTDELSKRFRSVALRRQHTWVASGIFDDEAFQVGDHAAIAGVEIRKAGGDQPGGETYTIGLASDGELPVGTGLVSLTADIDIRDWSARLDAADLAMATLPRGDAGEDAETALLRGEVAELRRQLARGETELARYTELEAKLAAAAGALAEYEALKDKYEDVLARHEEVVSSSSWRLTSLLRRLGGLLRGSRSCSSPELVFALAKGQNAFFRELAEALVFELEKLGATGRITVGEFPEQRPGSVTVLLPPHEYAALSRVRPSPPMLRRCVLISAEQPSSEFFEWNLALARDAGAVLDINQRAVRAYREAGIAAEHMQLGYCEAWDRRLDASERDIDVLFVGRSTPRRERALAHYADVLERLNCRFLLSDDSTPNTGDGVNFVSGEGKLRLLGRSKVLLNVHGEGEPYFEWLRVAEAMSCGCAVVTEHSTDLEPLRVGVDVVAGRLEALGLLAAGLAEDEAERGRIVASADARLREQAGLAFGATALLAAARRADLLPVSSEAAADVIVANAKMTIGPPPPPAAPPADKPAKGEHRTLRALKRQQQEILSFRRQLATDALARSRPDRPVPETIEVATTGAWKAGGEPRVSVIVPLFNDEEVVAEALDSVRRSTFSSWEIVVVDDASTDGGPAAVREWMERHDSHPARLVRHEVNRGLSAARNTGAAHARGRLFLMLDSDNLLRPFGLARLVRALSQDPHAAFAYGILDRFLKEGPLDLISNYGWEPVRFRDGNYIDALALIRRGAFTRLGGYSEDARLLLGYEDYDFWARLAEAGEWAVFVRQFVGRYRVGHSSMLSVTNISKVDAVAAIAEHAPQLMSGVELQT